jgi:uncharacterized protein YbjT (DUF2867 family)
MVNEAYLVTLATGRQGTATATATATELRKKGMTVHALVRNRTTAPAKALQDLGCILFEGNPDDITVVEAAMTGVSGLFVNIFPDSEDPTTQLRQAGILLAAAVAAETVISVVASTVLNCAKHAEWGAENPDYPMCYYYSRNFEIENAIRESGLKYYTILRPSFLMHNYLEPLCTAHFPSYGIFTLDVAYPQGTKTAHFDAYDVGRYAAAALLDPKQFDRHEIELGNQQLTIEQVAKALGDAVEEIFSTNYMTAEEVALWARKAPALAIRLWGEKEGAYTNDLWDLAQYGIPLAELADFAERDKVALRQSVNNSYHIQGKCYGEGDWDEWRSLGEQTGGQRDGKDEKSTGGTWEERVE